MDAKQWLRDDFITRQAQIERFEREQRQLQTQVKAIKLAQATADKRNKEKLESIHQERLKIGNERFERWINNFRWTLHVFYHESYFVTWLILVTFVLSGFPYYLMARFSISDQCLNQSWCRGVAVRLWEK